VISRSTRNVSRRDDHWVIAENTITSTCLHIITMFPVLPVARESSLHQSLPASVGVLLARKTIVVISSIQARPCPSILGCHLRLREMNETFSINRTARPSSAIDANHIDRAVTRFSVLDSCEASSPVLPSGRFLLMRHPIMIIKFKVANDRSSMWRMKHKSSFRFDFYRPPIIGAE